MIYTYSTVYNYIFTYPFFQHIFCFQIMQDQNRDNKPQVQPPPKTETEPQLQANVQEEKGAVQNQVPQENKDNVQKEQLPQQEQVKNQNKQEENPEQNRIEQEDEVNEVQNVQEFDKATQKSKIVELESQQSEQIPQDEYEMMLKEMQEKKVQDLANQVQGRQNFDYSVPKRRKVKKVKNETAISKKNLVINLQIEMKEWFCERLDQMNHFDNQTCWNGQLQKGIAQFLYRQELNKVYIWVQNQKGMYAYDQSPFQTQFLFFVKAASTNEITPANAHSLLFIKLIQTNYLKSLLAIMNSIFIPVIVEDNSWPQNVKKDFMAQLHKFMATITQASFQQQGFTELYIPKQNLYKADSQDKDLVQRLDATMMYWNRQIKQIVSNTQNQHDSENSGPLDEIQYWRSRRENLKHIDQQLDKPQLKEIVEFLLKNQSSYVKAFEEVTKNIKSKSQEASNNLLFLESLYQPCKNLEATSPKQIPELLPNLLIRVRMIWQHSKNYNTSERISGLLHKISNEIIKRCKSQINVSDMLDGDVQKCIEDLKESIDCCKKWKQIYEKTSKVITAKKTNQQKWDFRQNSIFAQIDAFIQRCSQLIQICEGQLQFAMRGSDVQIPCFGGSNASQIINILLQIKTSFGKLIQRFRESQKQKILDVKAPNWHDEYSNFKTGMKDLDVMYQNIISTAFDQVTTVQQGVQMLQAFDYLAKRDSIKGCLKRKSNDIMNLFVSEIEQFKYETIVNKKMFQLPLAHGVYSGHAIWARSLIFRIQSMRNSIDKLVFVDDSIKQTALNKYSDVYKNLQAVVKQHQISKWRKQYGQLQQDSACRRRIQTNYILCLIDQINQEKTKGMPELLKPKKGHLQSNFDKQLLKFMHQILAWKSLISMNVKVPIQFTDQNYQYLRVLREYAMIVVRDYNTIIDFMDQKEKKLFAELLEEANTVIYPGITRFKWSSKSNIDTFLGKHCKIKCAELYAKLKMFKNNTEKIQQKCQNLSEKPFLNINKKKVYQVFQFEQQQSKHRQWLSHKLKEIFQQIRIILCQTYEPFVLGKRQTQKVWFEYVQGIDKRIVQALRKAIKNTLLDFLKVVGDKEKNIKAIPIFKLSTQLDKTDTPKIVFYPTTDRLRNMVTLTLCKSKEIILLFKTMEEMMVDEHKNKKKDHIMKIEKELRNPLAQKHQQQKAMQELQDFQVQNVSYQPKVNVDSDIQKYTQKITQNLGKVCTQVNNEYSRNRWINSQLMWDQKKQDKYNLSIIQGHQNISEIRDIIDKFEIQHSNINHQIKSYSSIQCIVLDNINLKNTLVNIAVQWQQKFLLSLQEKCVQQLNFLHSKFIESQNKLSPSPTDLHSLKQNLDTWKQCYDKRSQIERRLKPLKQKLQELDLHNIQLKQEDTKLRLSLPDAWQNYNQMLGRIQIRNKKVRADFNSQTVKGLELFIKENGETRAQFGVNAPFQSSYSNQKAFTILYQYEQSVKSYRQRWQEMKFGFDLFNIQESVPSDLQKVDKEIINLKGIWELKALWDKTYQQEISFIKFKDVDQQLLEQKADDFLKDLRKACKEDNMRKWDIVTSFKNSIDIFKSILPLIKSLREPYMRTRHWEDLQKVLGQSLDPDSDDFTFDQIYVKKNFLGYSDSVTKVCEVARQQYKIESALQKVKTKWEALQLQLQSYKKTYKMKNTDMIFGVLQDHMGILSSQKTGLYYQSFKDQIQIWQNKLQKISDTLQLFLQVQRQWIYLEAIFASQSQQQTDRQLIGDISKFQSTNSKLSSHMQRIFHNRNVVYALLVQGFFNDLQQMKRRLDESQKILFSLLQRKRKDFPRFYFLSNDDLFELLGNSKDPHRVNKHIKKCFQGIKKLGVEIIPHPGKKNVEAYQVVQLISPEQEKVELNSKVPCQTGVENWLKTVQKQMRESLKKNMIQTFINKPKVLKDYNSKNIQGWIDKHQGQLLLTACQIQWTVDCETALKALQGQKQKPRNVWKFKDAEGQFINECSKIMRTSQNKILRMKLVAIITVQIHAKDIIDGLVKTCNNIKSFDWQKQLRFYKTQQGDSCQISVEQTNTKFPYGFQYQGNNGRLVVTALTDRCYMTLTTAMHLKKGGAPQGPAGTGKTETVKDLGKCLAKFVLVFNCSEGLDYKSLGKMFSGLMQTGGWGCFDEFNRIELQVLSVVAQQMLSILNALREMQLRIKNKTASDLPFSFFFEGQNIPGNDQCSIFITMNPGYAGRSQLPDNLKSLFRPISMMVPQSSVICQIMLSSQGFRFSRMLSVKIVTLYSLMTQQLSKQDHYDFGLRAVKSVLVCAGAYRRKRKDKGLQPPEPIDRKNKQAMREQDQKQQASEQLILMQAIRDMNIPKFVAQDISLFNALLYKDLFSNLQLEQAQNVSLIEGIEYALKEYGYVIKKEQVSKIVQLYDSKNTRHGNMLVGSSLSGKSTCWKILQKALNYLSTKNNIYQPVKLQFLNPKTVSLNQLFGYVDQNTMQWSEGVLSSMMARLCKTDQQKQINMQRWMILDGPVDTLWIESMNTVLDDNKVLTLLNGDRISLPNTMGLVFEVQDLAVASPATVSRAGMIYLNIEQLGWRPFIQSWINKIKDISVQQFLSELVDRWIVKLLNKKKDRDRSGDLKQIIDCLELNIVMSFCKLFDAFVATESKHLSYNIENKHEIYWNLLQKWFTYCIIWSFGATLDQSGRRLFDLQVRDIQNMFPHANTVFDYYINMQKNQWLGWEEKLSSTIWKPPQNAPFYKMLVPTIDSSKNRFVLLTCVMNRLHTLSVGITGTGKTVLINQVLTQLDQSSWTSMNIIFSSQTSALYLQQTIQGRLKKRAKNKWVPDGMKMVIFIDDLNMPKKDQFGSQPPLQLIRQWMDYKGWFDRINRQLFMYVMDIQFITAMGPPGGGRNQISKRLQSKFNIINFTFPSQMQVRRIFQSILASKFQQFQDFIRPMAQTISNATLQLYLKVVQNFLPTPAKSHYVFNMRDISKVIQGVFIFDKLYCDSKTNILRLWVHQCMRVFHDRLVNLQDRVLLKKLIGDQLQQILQSNMKECTNQNQEDTIFVDFVQQMNTGKQIYIQVPYTQRNNLTQLCKDQLEIYNEKFKRSTMNIVLFQEAVAYICKIHRIIKLGKGHGMLVGQGGAGRHSLTRLATWIASYQIGQVQVSKNFKLKDFRQKVKQWTIQLVKKDRPVVFMFSDNQIINESFVQDINTILTIGQIPNLYSKQDFGIIKQKTRKLYIETHQLTKDAKILDDKLLDFFHTKIQNMFHIVFLMSQTGDNLRNYCRMYPGLVNNTTLIWFMPWPGQALIEVASKYLDAIQLEQQQRKSISSFFCNAHTKVLKMANQMWVQLKRLYYVTPTNYVELVKGYQQLLKFKRDELGSQIFKLGSGLDKLQQAQTTSNQIQKTLALLQTQLSKKTKDCDQLVIKIERETRDSNQKKNQVTERQTIINKQKQQVQSITAQAESDLEKAMPALRNAEQQLKNLTKDKLSEVKSFSSPPTGVDTVLDAVMILLLKEVGWATAKKELADTNFLGKLQNFQRDKVNVKTLHKLQKLTSNPSMTLDKIDSKSAAAGGMWRWVLAIQAYAKAHKDIEPKRFKVNHLKQKLRKSQNQLQNLRQSFLRLQKQLQQLSDTLIKTQSSKKQYEEQADSLQKKLERAQKLINGLASTKIGWQQRKKKYQQKYVYLIGDALMSAAFLSYAGPFSSQYRQKFVANQLISQVKSLKIPYSRDYSFPEFLIKPVMFIKWQMKGLPDDQFSRENSVLVQKGRMYPLLIDPQLQGNRWIRQMQKQKNKDKLVIMDPQTENIGKMLKTSIAGGSIVIFQNLQEQIDSSVEPLLNKNIKTVAGKMTIYLGDEACLFNDNFRFYMTTKLPNPKYKAEVSTKVTLVNFAVKEKGLQQQLNSVIIQKMQQNLQNNKNEQISKKSQNQQLLKKLDDDILRMLYQIEGSLIQDQNLIVALDASKQTEEKVRHQIQASITQMKKIDTARKNYLRLATVASKLFFIINDFNLIDHMYQFALQAYIQLFGKIIKEYIQKPGLNDALQQKLDAIAERHKQAVYRYACRGLFQKDKLLLGLMMTVRLMQIDDQEYNFFLKANGDPTQDRKGQALNPNEWISQINWNIICDLEKMPNFSGIIGAFTHNANEWKRWYKTSNPEKENLPGQWNQKCDPLKKMIIIKAIRRDRVLPAATQFIIQKHGGSQYYVTPPPFNLESVYSDSNKLTPIIFILSPGVDPHHQLQFFAKSKGAELNPVSLGQGQAKKAKQKVTQGAKQGSWLYLANCHLSLSFLRELQKLLEYLEMHKNEVNQNFRLWLSTNPHPKFPISILQRCVKITTQPPKGIKANMLRLYSNIQREKFNGIQFASQYKKLIFSLCWFHSIIIERKRFKTLGWNTIYDFNDSDWETADKILRLYIQQSVQVTQNKQNNPLGPQSNDQPQISIVPPWQAIKFLISQVTYGGRVTDEFDRRLLTVYANEYFNQKVLNQQKHKLGDGDPNTTTYWIPEQLTAKQKALQKEGQVKYYYKQIMQNFSNTQTPQAFGQHINAQISSQIADTNSLIDAITSLQPKTSRLAGKSMEVIVKEIIRDTMEKVDDQLDLDEVYDKIKLSKVQKSDQTPNALKVVLVQQIARYNKVISNVKKSLTNLQQGISGQVLISQELENVMHCVYENKVPPQWKFAYYSLKPLSSWIDDLHRRIDQLRSWAYKGQPNVFWISGFSFPTGFTTALKQQASRNQGIAIDKFYWQFAFEKYDSTLSQPAAVGAYIDGLFLQGARWDGDKNCIIEPQAMRLYYPMPIIQFKPIHSEGGKQKVKKGQNFYHCPCYSYPIRSGVSQRPSYMLTVQLPCKPNPNSTSPSTEQQFWVKRGTALLMSLSQ